MKIVFAIILAYFSMAAGVCAAERMEITGAVAYTNILLYDYTGDGKRNRVRFWLEFNGRPALGVPGDAGYQAETGTIRYYLKDADNETKVLKWRQGLDMAGAPKDLPLPMNDISIEGNTARFEAFGMNWILVDGGEGHQNDKVIVNDGFKTLETKKLYGGDIRIGPQK